MTTPFRFSVVIATYNRPDYVLEAVRSVREQTYPAHQIIVVDDGGSDDRTANAVTQTYPEVCFYRQPNLGPSIAHNSGVALATGDWICFLDDDDLWHREKLAETVEYLKAHPDCQAVRNPVWFFSAEEPPAKSGNPFRSDFLGRTLEECHARAPSDSSSRNDASYLDILNRSHSLLLECNRGVLSATVVRRDTLIRAGGFSPMQTCGDDWTMFVNVARLCEWHLIPRRLGFTRLHAAQNTSDPNNGLYTLAGYVNAWFTGRPLPDRTSVQATRARLRHYGSTYRRATQEFFWNALRAGDWVAARCVYHLSHALLLRWRDRVYMMIPPQLTWRVERYLFGMHK